MIATKSPEWVLIARFTSCSRFARQLRDRHPLLTWQPMLIIESADCAAACGRSSAPGALRLVEIWCDRAAGRRAEIGDRRLGLTRHVRHQRAGGRPGPWMVGAQARSRQLPVCPLERRERLAEQARLERVGRASRRVSSTRMYGPVGVEVARLAGEPGRKSTRLDVHRARREAVAGVEVGIVASSAATRGRSRSRRSSTPAGPRSP